MNNWKGMCQHCKFFEQGKTHSFCGNPKQKNTDLKDYVYYTFGCSLVVKGTAQSRLDFMKKEKVS